MKILMFICMVMVSWGDCNQLLMDLKTKIEEMKVTERTAEFGPKRATARELRAILERLSGDVNCRVWEDYKGIADNLLDNYDRINKSQDSIYQGIKHRSRIFNSLGVFIGVLIVSQKLKAKPDVPPEILKKAAEVHEKLSIFVSSSKKIIENDKESATTGIGELTQLFGEIREDLGILVESVEPYPEFHRTLIDMKIWAERHKCPKDNGCAKCSYKMQKEWGL